MRFEHSEQSNPAQPSVTADVTSNDHLRQSQLGMSYGSHSHIAAAQYGRHNQPTTGHYGHTPSDQLLSSSTDVQPAAIRSSFGVGVSNSLFSFLLLM